MHERYGVEQHTCILIKKKLISKDAQTRDNSMVKIVEMDEKVSN